MIVFIAGLVVALPEMDICEKKTSYSHPIP